MAMMTDQQKQLIALWVMLTTNNDVFQGASAIPAGASSADVAAKTKQVIQKLTLITGIDNIKPQMVAATMRDGANTTFAGFGAVRDLYQSFAQFSGFWPPAVAAADHPPLVDLQDTLFPKS